MIPYATVEAAEAALGRALTAAEAAWFRHSGFMPDYCLYFESLVILLAAYSLTALPLALLELCAPASSPRRQAAAPGAAVASCLPPLLQGHASRLGAPHHWAPLVPPLPGC